MDIAKWHEINLTDSRISNPLHLHRHHHRNEEDVGEIGRGGNDEIRNLNYNNSTSQELQDFQDNYKQQQNPKWNQFVSSKVPIKSRLKSPSHQENNNKNQGEYEKGSLILTHAPNQEIIAKYNQADANVNSTDISVNCKEERSNYPHDQNDPRTGEQVKNGGVNVNDDKVNPATAPATGSPSHTPWNRIFQCFGVFKPRKISSSMNLNSTSTTANNLFGQAKAKTTTAELLKPHPQPPELRRIMTDLDFCLQELADSSEILNRNDTKNLGAHFPPRCIGNCWEKTFSTTQDGFSLHNLYRKLDGIDSPVLFVIEDIEKRVFGAVLSCAFKVSENFYGNSDTFLFRCRPEFEVFKWSGDNFYFIQGQDGFISVGSDDGRYGLWLDDNMYNGRSEKCSTFNSPALVPEKDFKIKTVECWTVGIF